MMKILWALSLMSLNLYADNITKWDLSGNFDAQMKGLKNSKTAMDHDQDWTQETFSLLYSNIRGRVYFKKSKFNINWFLRYGQSKLYQKDYVAPRFSMYPNNVVARDIFELETIESSSESVFESILNEFNYEWGDDETVFNIGRMFIDFGQGFVFNPINPFMLPTGFSTLQNIKQGNDGLKFYMKPSADFRVHFYLLGDKQFTDYNGKVTRSLLFRGQWDYSEQIHINYILGEDQKRHKYGFEILYAFNNQKGKLFGQAVRNSQRLDKEDPGDNGLFHYLVGYEHELTSFWTGRLEFGKYDVDNTFLEPNYAQNFLPQKNFIALVNLFRVTDLVKIGLNGSVDPISGFSYFHIDVNHEYSKKLQFHVFMSGPMSRAKDEAQFAAQRVFAGEVGLGLRSVF